jgi:hypothetical protein
LTTATGGLPARSVSESERPRASGIPRARKYASSTRRTSAVGFCPAGRRRTPHDAERRGDVHAAEGDGRACRRRRDAGQGADPFYELLEEPRRLFARVAVRKDHPKREHACALEAGFDAAEIRKGADEEEGAHGQHHRERDLPGGEESPQPHRPAPGGGARSSSERGGGVVRRSSRERDQPEHDAGGKRDHEGESDGAAVQGDLFDPRDLRGGPRDEEVERPSRREEAREAAGEGKRDALDKRVPRDL